MSLNRFLFISAIFLSQVSHSQNGIDHLHYLNRIDGSHIYMADSIDLHSGVLPIINLSEYGVAFKKSSLQLTQNRSTTLDGNKYAYRFYLITDIAVGIEGGLSSSSPLKYNFGAGVGIDYTRQKLFVTAKLMPYLTQSNYVADSVQNLLNMDLGTTRPITGSVFHRNEFLIAYRPHKIFTFLGGYGKNFFGEGYRSLLLSDNASNYPFLKIETAFGGIKYVNLYTVWNDNSVNPFDKSLDLMKFSSMHYLSWNITPEFNLSIFESVVWQAKDTLALRGFDFNYVNPVVFYRPVEYSNGSADNVLLGMNLSYKISRHHCFYSQIVLDEFLLSQIKSDQKWWGNKYGFQFGYKTNHFFSDKIYFQTELNLVRPFTYSHKYSIQNFGHLNASVTHPIGANFYELLNIVSYKSKKFNLTHKLTFAAFGVNTDSVNVGQNIFNSYADRNGEFGHLIMQGERRNSLNEQIIFEIPLLAKIDLYMNATYNYRMQWTQNHIDQTHFFMIGIRSRIWNTYNDL